MKPDNNADQEIRPPLQTTLATTRSFVVFYEPLYLTAISLPFDLWLLSGHTKKRLEYFSWSWLLRYHPLPFHHDLLGQRSPTNVIRALCPMVSKAYLMLSLFCGPKVISVPVVVTVHGNQQCDAEATVFWDNAFADKVSYLFSSEGIEKRWISEKFCSGHRSDQRSVRVLVRCVGLVWADETRKGKPN